MKKALPIIVYTLVLVLVTGMIASGATLLAVSAARVDQGDTVTISRDEYATLQKYTKISNIKAYMVTALYNAPSTINHYYQQEVQHDMYGGGWHEKGIV